MQWTETATGDRWSSGQDHQIWGQVGHARGRRPWRPRTVDTSGGCGAGQVTIVPRAGGRRGRARPVLIRPGLRAWQGHPGRPMPRARCRRARRAPSPASSGGGDGVAQTLGTVSQRHVKSRGESASGCSRGGRFPVRAGSGGREALLPGRLEGERVRADTGSQCQNDAGRCGTQECPVCRGAAGTPCGARRAHAAITHGIAVLSQKWGTEANFVVFPNESVPQRPRCPVKWGSISVTEQILLGWTMP